MVIHAMNEMNKLPIYLDHAATTPVRNEVIEAMSPYFNEIYGNPSSIHGFGRRASTALDRARKAVADLLGAHEREIIFTGGGTEGDNMALRGIALANRDKTGANRLIVSAIEHHAVYHTAQALAENNGFDLSLLPVNHDALVSLEAFEDLLADTKKGDAGSMPGSDVALVSVMMANNEVGSVQPIAEIGKMCRERKIPFHTDAVQAAGRLSLQVNELGVDALSISGHKIYGPKGVGCLYLRRGTPFRSMSTGGTHEHSYRAGTENVPGIVGLATALSLAESERSRESKRLQQLRDHLISSVVTSIEGAYLTGDKGRRLPHIASFIIPGAEAEGVLIGLDMAGIAASSGSACTSGAQRPSHVLEAMGITGAEGASGLRFSLGRDNSTDEIEYVVSTLSEVVNRIRDFAPVPI